jgi:hypothetical protein
MTVTAPSHRKPDRPRHSLGRNQHIESGEADVLTGREKTFEFDFPSLGVAALGAIVLLALLRLLHGAGDRR